MPKKPDLIPGTLYGRLTIVTKSSKVGTAGKSYYECACECGKALTVSRSSLISEKQKSCGCFRRDYAGRAFRGPAGNASHNTLYMRCAKGARSREIPFELSRDQHVTLTTGACHYCGQSPQPFNVYESVYTKVKRTNISAETFNAARITINGVDRVDPAKGYTAENCVSCCYQCNTSKLDYSEAEFIAHAYAIVAFQEAKKRGAA